MPELNASEESKIRKVIKENALTLIFLTGTVFSFIMFVVIPQQETAKNIALIQQSINNINTNHEAHLQDFGAELVKLSEIQTEQTKTQTELMKEITVFSTRLEDHLNDDK